MVAGHWSTHSAAGRVVAGEPDKIYIPYGWKGDGARRSVVWGHGAGGTYQIGPIERQVMAQLRTVWVCATNGGGTGNLARFGDDASCANVMSCFAKAVELYGAADDKFVFWGGSMGGLTGACSAFYDPTKVAAVGMAIPALHPEYVRLNDVSGMKDEIEAVYGANPVPAAKQVYARGSDFAALGIPAAMWYSTSDSFTPQASSEEFAADAGAAVEAHSMGAVGHSYLSIDVDEVVAFLREHI